MYRVNNTQFLEFGTHVYHTTTTPLAPLRGIAFSGNHSDFSVI